MTDIAPDGRADLLTGNRVVLRPLMPGDHPALYALSMSDQISFRWRYRGAIPPPDVFERSLYQNVFCQFVVAPRTVPDRLMGLVVSYNASMQDGFCYLAVVADGRVGGVAIEAVALMLRYVFRHWPFRKVYIETTEFNLAQFRSAVDYGLLKEEGRLKAHHYFDELWWDLITFAIYREDARAFASQFPTVFPTEESEPRVL